MTTHVERSIEVEVPVRTAYDQWTQFEEFPRFMSGVQEVRQIGEAMTHWVAEIAGVRREWDAAILEQVPDEKVAWAATTGATNAGAVYFQAVGEGRTQVRLTLDYEPEGIVERVADVLDVVQRQAVADLDRFKEFIEQQGSASGGWRGRVDDGDVRAGAAGAAGAAAGPDDRAAEVPGDVVAVGPTGGTHATLDTEGGGAVPASAYLDDDGPGVGHSGDPVAVDPAAATAPTGTAADADPLARTPSGVPVEGDPVAVEPPPSTAHSGAPTAAASGVPVDDPQPTVPRAGAVGGDPVAVDPTYATARGTETGGTDAGGPTEAAATTSAGVAGFGTDTGLRSDDPASGALTGDPEAGTTRGATVDDSWTADGRDDARDAAGFEESRTGFGETGSAGARREVGDGDEVLERDFANREVVHEDVQRDFANRDITPQDVAHKGVHTGMGGARDTGTTAREAMKGDTGFQGTESTPDPAPERTDS